MFVQSLSKVRLEGPTMQAEHVLCGFSVMTMIDTDELRKNTLN